MRTATRSSQSRAVRQVRGFDGWGLRLPRWRPQSADARSWFQPGPSPSSRSSIRTPRDRILATRFGLKAADLANEGRYGRMAACIATRSWTSPSKKPRGSSRLCHPSGTRSRAPSSDSRATIVASPEWRNWQTRGTQNPVSFGTCGFDPHLRHDQTGPSCTVVRCREIECARHAGPEPSAARVPREDRCRNDFLQC